ncbi:hypothetical protein BVX94_03030 [bacterium B17]|nr:hypothetical protein BVX94_03030 [bacterium B17]
MKAIQITEIGSFELTEVQTPDPAGNEVLVKVDVAGLCRTDLKIIEVGHRDLTLPRIPAEEVVGTICELGDNVDSSWQNKRVYIYPGTSCGECEACLKEAENLCQEMQIMGFHRDGGFAEFVTAPVESLIELLDELSAHKAVFAEPLSCCLNALELANLKKDEAIGIWGSGPAGTLLSKASEAIGAKPTVIEPDARRRKLINGIEKLSDELFDVAIPAVGSPDAYKDAVKHLKPRGRLVAFSGLPHDNCTIQIDTNSLHYLEQTIVGAYGCSYKHGVQAIELINSGKIQVEDMISHEFPLENIEDALELVRTRAGMKILLYPNRKAKKT